MAKTTSNSFWNVNTINQILTAILWVLAFAGLQINADQTATDLTNAIVMKSWPFVGLIITNIGTMFYYWIKTWNTDRPNFLAFLKSINWWFNVANLVAGAFKLFTGIDIPPEATQKIVQYIFDRQWWELLSFVFISLILPIIRRVVNKSTAKGL